MANPFIDIVRTAERNKWCTTPYCTTCIAREYRQALKDLGGQLGGGLADALSELRPSEITCENNWQNALLTAIIDLPMSLQGKLGTLPVFQRNMKKYGECPERPPELSGPRWHEDLGVASTP